MRIISDSLMRNVYQRCLAIGTRTGAFVSGTYDLRGRSIHLSYIDDDDLNAAVGLTTQTYGIRISKAAPTLIFALLAKLLERSDIMPWLPNHGSESLGLDVALPVDPQEPLVRTRWSAALSPSRAHTAMRFTEIAVVFIMMHEIGHVLCGHVEGQRHYEGRGELSELVARRSLSPVHFERRQAWEYDADAVAVSLLVPYLEYLPAEAEQNAMTKEMLGGDRDPLGTLLSIVPIILFVLFSYMAGARTRIIRESTHPHPMVRTRYLKSMLLHAAHNRWPFELATVAALIDERLDETLRWIQESPLYRQEVFADSYLDAIDEELEHLLVLQERYRPSCRAWSRIEWFQSTL